MSKNHIMENFDEVIFGNNFLEDTFTKCTFRTEITNADFIKSIFRNSHFQDCGISYSDFVYSEFLSCSSFKRCKIHMCSFGCSFFDRLTVNNVTFDGCIFRSVEITENTVFENCFFTDCLLSGICIPENRTFLDVFRNCNFENCGEF